MKLQISKNNFLNLDDSHANLKSSRVVIVPFGMEHSVSYGHGTAKGPEAIIRASHEVELFDEELKCEPYKKIGVATLKAEKIASDGEGAIEQVREITSEILSINKIPIILGGEHTLTAGVIQAMAKKYQDITILHFDAHADLRDSYLGNKFSHACVMRRCLDLKNVRLVQVGIRNISNEVEDGAEYDFWEKNQKRIKTYWAKDGFDIANKEFIKSLGEYVCISFDVDCLDTSIMPSTGTPEPGGFSWYEVLKILRIVGDSTNVVGMDFVELSPVKNSIASDFLIAKLIYKAISYCI
ncbi:MAG: agmatinase [Candidatus Portnoybacteria bacterium CG10_big_fil_rev_8_21_14_0_10_36_7]|uniref:Agmatinase n=1 Tax=Candidatus Portnoybacteria bacterium CG10_big_fil_rev_8_21_14_0_10_36_7 TaxID=1974812 RepID=A0A2M8KEC6_9BACT|nr:MAG: agmatinase [Candidatus Portnoybacteria bacterium CG10_big_fil_rev_8_21_14_0_10_36_7]